jgi:hypothetical protein
MSLCGDYAKRVCCHSFRWDAIRAIASTKSSALSKTVFLVRLAFGQALANPTQRPSPPRTETTALMGRSKDFPTSAGTEVLQESGGSSATT